MFIFKLSGQIGPILTAVSTWGTRAFNSFKELKDTLGSQLNFVWHHIVEQRLDKVSSLPNQQLFTPQQINNTENVARVTTQVNSFIAAYYARALSFTEGMTLRAWLGSQSYQDQLNFGKAVLQRVLSNKSLPQ